MNEYKDTISGEKADEILVQLKHLDEMQIKLDKRTKDAQAYKDCFNISQRNTRLLLISFTVILVSLFAFTGITALGVVNKYLNYEATVSRVVTTETDDMSVSNGGTIINDSSNTAIGKE